MSSPRVRKAVELPMNTLVVIAIAIIILLSLVAFFISGGVNVLAPFAQSQELRDACSKWANTNCDPSDPVVGEVFNAYNKWKKAFRKSGSSDLCTWSDVTSGSCQMGGKSVTENDVIEELRKQCVGCGPRWGGISTSGSPGGASPKSPGQVNFENKCNDWKKANYDNSYSGISAVFEAYNNWKKEYKTSSNNLCTWSDVTSGSCQMGGKSVTENDVKNALKTECQRLVG